MFKFTSFVLYAVVLSLSNVYADDPDEFLSLIEECARLHGHTMTDLYEVMGKDDVSAITPCFWSCAFTKTGFFNDRGQYDIDAGLISIKKFMKDSEGLKELEQIARQCESVINKDISDGDAGCERGVVAAKCFLGNLHVMK
ncbi:hypothetical protein PYW08_011729 [Mythimna loreyi]|uniref:Uncharacterized protein n=1 Tax=Mythimna loreyi TaxID=667449 RepID=A0ACC2QKA3_9NEOP|nr:hypothetical protein PYW08_011729 [Mythimna loreyi]